MNTRKALVAVAVALAIAAFAWFDLGRFLDLDFLRRSQAAIAAFVDANPLIAVAGFFVLYVGVTALSIPGAAVMTLAAGAVFGLVTGTLIVSFASSLGATLAFLLARYLLRDWVEGRFAWATERINRGVDADGAYYLFTLRLVPVLPFFVINLVMALTRLRTPTFYWVSQLGMLPGTLVYVNAGTQLGEVGSPGDILSPGLLASFALLGLFPLLARKTLAVVGNARGR